MYQPITVTLSTYHINLSLSLILNINETRSTITKNTSQPDAQASPTYASTKHVLASPTYASTKHIPISPTYITRYVSQSCTRTSMICNQPYTSSICQTMYHVSNMYINTCTIPCTKPVLYHVSINYINLYHTMHQPCTMYQSCTSTMYINPIPYHVLTMYINTCTIPCINHVHQHMYHTMYQPCTILGTSTMYHIKYINMYHTMHQPCTTPSTSTMYYTKYINHVLYQVHQPCIISCINHVPYHKISSMKCLKNNQDSHNTKIPI
jgi:hypothetical protein